MKKFACCFLLITGCILTNSEAQTIFTYGTDAVSKQEFLKAYQKNNGEKSSTEKSFRNYLELYIRFKLKVKAALDLGLDTLTSQRTELQNFRNQVADSYINDNASMNKLVHEAFERSQKDIRLAHIFIAAPGNATPADTLKAFQKAAAAYAALKKGKDFGEVAVQYSEDPTAKQNFGEIGYITVFTLPYDLENLAYGTLPGRFSKIYRSKTGYHIFKNIAERKAIGKIKAAQILFVFPPNPSDQAKAALKRQADSVYGLLKSGAGFGELAKKFSGDNLSYQTNGELAEFGVGKYEPAFEDAAFALKKDGDISEPVMTSFGYHILKRLGRNPVSATPGKQTMDAIKPLVLADPRVAVAKKQLLQKILAETNFKRATVDENSLWIMTDSTLRNKPLASLNGVDNKTLLFSFPKKNMVVADWLNYAKSARNIPTAGASKTYKEIFEQFLQTSAFDYYRNHLEDYNKDFAYQLNEFREGNMLFEIMQRKIWNIASVDSTGLRNYFEANKNKYWWDPSADAILFTCNNENAANNVQRKLQNNIQGWKKLLDASDGSTQADSGRFLLTQLPIPEKKNFNPGQYTAFTISRPDNTVTFAYIITIYTERSPRNFTEARGLATNDYQSYLEDKWIGELKKKYPVKIDESVFKTLK